LYLENFLASAFVFFKVVTQDMLTDDSSHPGSTQVKSAVDLSKSSNDLSQIIQVEKNSDLSQSAETNNGLNSIEDGLTPFEREWAQGREEKLKPVVQSNYRPDFGEWIKHWKANPEYAKKLWEHFKSAEKELMDWFG